MCDKRLTYFVDTEGETELIGNRERLVEHFASLADEIDDGDRLELTIIRQDMTHEEWDALPVV